MRVCKDCANPAKGSRAARCEACTVVKRRAYGKMEGRARRIYTTFGLSAADVEKTLARQQGCCLCCKKAFDPSPKRQKADSFYVDHDHATGKVRGFLCLKCNAALGFLSESPVNIRRMLSYLQYDRAKLNVYLVGSLKNPKVLEVGNALRAEGFEALDEWYGSGPEADDKWQEYEKVRGRNYREALAGRGAQNVFLFDRSLLDLADAAVLIAPGGRSSFLELGYAVGCGKPAFILDDGDANRRFEVMPNFATAVLPDLDSLIARLKQIASTVL